MKRVYKQPPVLQIRQLGTVLFAVFVVFVALRILTPPSEDLQLVVSPDGTRTARLQRYYYLDEQPSYKIYWRETPKTLWQGLYHLPAYTNIPPGLAEPELAWSADSHRLDFLMNGTSVWYHVFSTE